MGGSFGLGIGVGFQFVQSSGVSATGWNAAYVANVAQLNADYGGQGYALSAVYTAEGDSLSAGNQAGNSGDPWPDQIGIKWVSTTVDNEANGGHSTTQILADVTALSPAKKAGIVTINGGGNDVNDNTSVLATLTANFDAMVAQLTTTKYLLSGFSGAEGAMAFPARGIDRFLLNKHLEETYGEKFVNLNWSYIGAKAKDDWDDDDKLAIMLGYIPPSYKLPGDTTHPDDPGIDVLANVFGPAVIAIDGGVPDPLPAVVPLDDTAASGATLHQMLVRGTASSWRIVDGDDDGVLSVNSSGLITRSTGTLSADYTTALVGATGAGAERQAPVVFARKNGTGITGGCQFHRYGAMGYRHPFGTTGEVDDFTMIWRIKAPAGTASGDNCELMGGWGGTEFLHFSGAAVRVRLYDNGGALIVSNQPSGGITVTDWHWVGVSYQRGVSSVCKVMRNNTVTTPAITNNDKAVDFRDVMLMFAGLGGYPLSNSAPRDIGCIWMADEYLDLGDSSIRDLIFNSSTFAPVALVNGREISGVVPEVYFAGKGPGNYLPPSNRGTSGDLTHNEPTLFGDEMYTSVDE